MSQRTVDVVVVGAGVAGLAAAARLCGAGADVVVLEARTRPGGRIATVAGLPPLELGAEFLPADGEAARRLAEAGAVLAPVATGQGRLRGGAIERLDLEDAIGPALAALPDPRGDLPDTSLADALTRADVEATAGEQLRRYVEQYHAALAEEVSARWVAAVEDTGEGGGGGAQVRVLDGLDRLPRLLLEEIGAERLRFGHRVTRVGVQPGGVRVDAEGPEGAGEWRARVAVVTVPIGVLRSGRLAVDPIPPAHRAALDGLRMGAVVKLVLRFRRPFWDPYALEDLTFLQDDGPFPTVWTPAPLRAPTLVAWAGGAAAAAVSREAPDMEALVERAVEQLARMFGVPPAQVRDLVERAERRDWSADPEAGGAYPWARVGAAGATADLRVPIDGRLILTGDGAAAEMGTVDGALSAGWCAAGRFLEALRS